MPSLKTNRGTILKTNKEPELYMDLSSLKTAIQLKTGLLPAPESEPEIQLLPANTTADLENPGVKVGDVNLVRIESQMKVVVSLGNPSKINPDTYRQAGGRLADWLSKRNIPQLGVEADHLSQTDLFAFCEGLLLGAYKFGSYKKPESEPLLTEVVIRSNKMNPTLEKQVKETGKLIEAVNLAREWQHEPANVINPLTLAERALSLSASLGVKCTILDDDALTKMGAGAITAVGKGSKTPSRLIVLEYPGKRKGVGKSPVALVGKAITFDTGGYSLKDTANIQKMKYDKCGGIDVLAIIKAAVELEIETPLVAVVCAAENMISGHAYRPDDILTSLSGKTIEIITTDAEGRLVLADGLTYAQRTFKPSAVIDMATLTGGVVTALGRVRAGIFSNNDNLAQQLFEAGERTHERLWRLPLDDDYFTNIKGDDADIKNSGGKEGHPINGGIFLKQFIENDTPWAHLDIAGVADSPKDLPYSYKGATGFGIRLIVNYLKSLEA